MVHSSAEFLGYEFFSMSFEIHKREHFPFISNKFCATLSEQIIHVPLLSVLTFEPHIVSEMFDFEFHKTGILDAAE